MFKGNPPDLAFDQLFQDLIRDDGTPIDIGIFDADIDDLALSADGLNSLDAFTASIGAISAAPGQQQAGWLPAATQAQNDSNDLAALAELNQSRTSSDTTLQKPQYSSQLGMLAGPAFPVTGWPAFQQPAQAPDPALAPPSDRARRTSSAAGGGAVRGAAQRRHRQRQKEQLSQLQQELGRKLQEVQQLQQQNSELKLRTEVLEKVVEGCDQQIFMIERDMGKLSCSDADATTPPSTTPSASNTSPSHNTNSTTITTGEQTASLSSPSASTSSQQPAQQQQQAQLQPANSACGAGPECLPVPSLSPSFSAHEVAGRYRQLVQQLAKPLLLADRPDPDPAAMQEVGRLVMNLGGLCHHVAVLYCHVMSQVCSMNMDSLRPEAPADPEHNSKLYRALCLTSSQKKLLAGFNEIYAAASQRNLRERQQVMARLEGLQGRFAVHLAQGTSLCPTVPAGAATAVVPAGGGASSSAEDGVAGSKQLDVMMEAMQALQANLLRHHRITVHCTFYFFNKVLDMVQIARLATLSYPYFPDAWLLTRMAAEDVAGLQDLQGQQLGQQQAASGAVAYTPGPSLL